MIDLIRGELFGTAAGSPLQYLCVLAFLLYPFLSLPVIVYLFKRNERSSVRGMVSSLNFKAPEPVKQPVPVPEAIIEEEPIETSATLRLVSESTDRCEADVEAESDFSLTRAAKALVLSRETTSELRSLALDFLVSRGKKPGKARKQKTSLSGPVNDAGILASCFSQK